MDTPEQRMPPIELVGTTQRNEPLRVVRIPLAIVGHAYQAAAVKLQTTVDLVLERFAVDALTAHACASGVAALGDKSLNDTVKDDAVVVAWSQRRSAVDG